MHCVDDSGEMSARAFGDIKWRNRHRRDCWSRGDSRGQVGITSLQLTKNKDEILPHQYKRSVGKCDPAM